MMIANQTFEIQIRWLRRMTRRKKYKSRDKATFFWI